MFLLYIDDSGTCELKKDQNCEFSGGNSRYFVLGSILLQATELNKIENETDDLKDYCLTENTREIKYSLNKKLLTCQYSCEKDFNDLTCYRTQVAQLLSKINCTMFASIQDKYYTTSNNIVQNKMDIYQLSFETLLKSVDTYMYNNKINEPVICFIDKKDTGDSKDMLIYSAYKKSLRNKDLFKAFNNTIFSPTINVVYSQYTTGAQLADFIAGSIWSFYENTDLQKKNRIKENNKLFKDKFYKIGLNNYVGLSFCDKNIILK